MASLIFRLIRHWNRRHRYRIHYLHGHHWVDFRRAYWRANPHRGCFVCGCGHPLDLHHVTYARVGHEQFSDVIPLCRAHHDDAHRNRRQNWTA